MQAGRSMNMTFERLNAEADAAFRGAFHWWLSELKAMLPWQPGTDPDRAPVILDLAAEDAALVLAGHGARAALRIPVDHDDIPQVRTALQAALQERGLGSPVVIRLDPSLLLETDLTLPFGAERAMRQILENQLDRVVPLPAEEVEFEYRIAHRTAKARSLQVHLTVVARSTIEAALDLARSLGLAPQRIVAAGDHAPVVLWRVGRDGRNAPRFRRLCRVLELAAIVLIATAFGTLVYRLDQQIDDMQEDIALKTRLAAAARDLGQQQQQAEAALAMLRDREREPKPLMVLEEATLLVPDNSWVTRMTVRGRTVELLGNSPRVSDLVARLDNHDMFWDPQFLSPITQAPDGRTQRFNLSFQIWLEGDDP